MDPLIPLAHRIARVLGPEAPDWGPLGMYGWPSRREGVPEEPDNAIESELFDALKKHFSSSRVGMPAHVCYLLSLCLRFGWYKEILHPPPYKVLYRGLKIMDKEVLLGMLGFDESEFEDSGAQDFNPGVTILPTNGYSTSWSSKKIITRDFSEAGKRGWTVTTIADVVSNPFKFLAGPGGLYDVEGMSQWHLEKETVGLEPIMIRRIEWAEL